MVFVQYKTFKDVVQKKRKEPAVMLDSNEDKKLLKSPLKTNIIVAVEFTLLDQTDRSPFQIN